MPQRLAEFAPPPVRTMVRRGVRLIRRAGYIRANWPPPLGSRPPIELAVCCIFRDEGRYLAEWVTFHRLQGVERFYLYDNLSTDDGRAELDPEIAAGIVDVTPWSIQPGQASAYLDCLQRHREHARWIAFIDADEFLFSPTGHPLPEVLRRFNTHPGVAVNWRCYGPNGWDSPPDGLLIENYPLRAPDNHPTNESVKAIAHPRKVVGIPSCHYFRYRGGPSVGEDGRPANWSRRAPPTADLLRINHYFAKSTEEYRRKIARPTAWDGKIGEAGIASWPDVPPDEVRDDAILRFAPTLKAALSNRRSLAGGA